ncbi:MAG: SUMF1/EgtB/PvdO family nonheme iron enzyme [Verrucomicrobiae bacterium]|nr:SUMF1/EgtB/PvdO family nonheme iron enzyme [Verrucomicrobiae bacterium]
MPPLPRHVRWHLATAVLFVFAFLVSLAEADSETETNSLGMTLRLLEGGRYVCGTDARERGLAQAFPLSVNAQFFGNPETPAHVTWITKPFWIGATEVTVGQWKKFVAETGHVTSAEKNGEGIIGWSPTPEEAPLYQSHDFERKPEFTWKNPGFPQDDSHPVVGVSWEDVQAFLTWLSKKEGVKYRLPTEAEWEFACRAGTDTWFSFGDEPRGQIHQFANLGNVELEKHRKHSVERQWLLDWDTEPADGHVFTAPVGQYQPNDFGLYDMHGNVWEWCADLWLDTYYHHWDWPDRGQPRGIAVDPVNESEPQTEANRFRTIRGGSWYNGPVICRSSNRTYWDEPDAAAYLGFRVVREADPNISTTAREAYEREREALAAVTNSGGELRSADGLTLQVSLEGDPIDLSVLGMLPRVPSIDSLSLGPRKTTPLTNADLEAIAKATSIRQLDFKGSFDLSEADLSILTRLPTLESVSFSRSTTVSDAELAELSNLKTLKVFRCYGTSGNITDAGLTQLAGNRSLETLEVFETSANGSFLEAFAGCPLRSLSFTSNYQGNPVFGDEQAKALARFPGLTQLFLNGQGLLSELTLLTVGNLTQLEELGLHGCTGFSPSGFGPLGKLAKLRTLNLQATHAGDKALTAIAAVPRLQSLRIGSETAQITDEGFATLTESFSLESLYIENSDATDRGLEYLGRVNRLETLDLGSRKITGTGLGPITRLPELRDLRLRCPELTNVVFEQLARARSLKKLRLVERGWRPPAALSDDGLTAISRATWLTELWLPRNDTGLTEAGMNALKPLMPKTSVIPYTVDWNKEES